MLEMEQKQDQCLKGWKINYFVMIFEIEPKTVDDSLNDENQILAMQDKLN